ncbi:MAG TPA: PLP-dependent aminotransferase family protein, partial [Actinomycetes bacterium]|nr:PLP-dependent aminotransferase family protein [Actinomycetes bacterium]
RLLGVAAGLHLLVLLDQEVDCADVVTRAAAAGVRVADLATYRSREDAIGPGLVLGYGNLADTQVEEAVALLVATMAEAAG